MLQKVALFLVFLMMVGFVLVQYNDPDGSVWMIAYGFVAAMVGLAFLGRLNKWPILIGLFGFFITSLFYFPSMIKWVTKEQGQNLMQRMNSSKMYIEETREFFGLIICVLIFIWLFVVYKKKVGQK